MALRSQLSGVVGAGLAALACSSATEVELRDERLELNSLTAPSTVVSGQPLKVDIRYGIGACDEVTAVSGQLVAVNRLEVQVRGRFVPPPQAAGCIAILYHRDTSLTVIAPQPGVLTVVGLQPREAAPIERSVTVSPPN